MNKCSDCKYSITMDYGYSNWTVMGTEIDCLEQLNPQFPCDLGYGLPKELQFAETCPKFSRGEGISIDCDNVDGDYENYTDDPEIKILAMRYQNRS